MYTDPISDYLTRIRNAIMANHDKVYMPASIMKNNMSSVLLDKGYIKDFQLIDDQNNIYGGRKVLEISLKYNFIGTRKQYAITKLVRISKPGLRKYSKCTEIPSVLNGLGISILSTSKGVLSDKEARKMNIGGELLCYVY